MAFTFLGQQVDNINFNGSPLDRLQFNGVTVWERSSGDYVLVENSYYEGADGQWYQKLVKYGEITPGCTIETPGTSSTSYGWIEDTESTDKVEGYTYIMSDNKGNNSTWAAAKISWEGFTSVKFYYRSYAESNYDYTILSTLDFDGWTSLPTYNSSGVYVHTRSSQTTTFNTVTYECSPDPHHIWIVYRKDASASSDADRGYFGYIAEYQEILDVKAGSLLPSEYVWNGDLIFIDGKQYQKIEREYTLPNGNKVINHNDYQVGEEVESIMQINFAGWSRTSNGGYYYNNPIYGIFIKKDYSTTMDGNGDMYFSTSISGASVESGNVPRMSLKYNGGVYTDTSFTDKLIKTNLPTMLIGNNEYYYYYFANQQGTYYPWVSGNDSTPLALAEYERCVLLAIQPQN